MFKTKNLLLLVSFILVAALVAGCGGQTADKGEDKGAADADVIKIGFLGDLTGDTAVYGQNTLDGMKMAADELNAAGGVLGKEVKIVVEVNTDESQYTWMMACWARKLKSWWKTTATTKPKQPTSYRSL